MDRKSIGAALAAQSLSIFLKLAVGTAVGLQSLRQFMHFNFMHDHLRIVSSTPFLCELARPAL